MTDTTTPTTPTTTKPEDDSLQRIIKKRIGDAIADPKFFTWVITGVVVPIIAVLSLHKTLEGLTQGLASIDPGLHKAAAPLIIIIGFLSYGAARRWPGKRRGHEGATVHITGASTREIIEPGRVREEVALEAVVQPTPAKGRVWRSRHALAFAGGVIAIVSLSLYLMLYHVSVVHLDAVAKKIIWVNSDTGDSYAAKSEEGDGAQLAKSKTQEDSSAAAAPTTAPVFHEKPVDDNLILPLPLPAEIRDYAHANFKANTGAEPGLLDFRAGISEIVSKNPLWLYNKLEHDYSDRVAVTKILLMISYLFIFIATGFTCGWMYKPVESLAELFHREQH